MLTQEAAKTFLQSPIANLFNLNSEDDIGPASYTKVKGRIYITCDGMTKTLSEWADYVGINRNTLYSRIYRGWEVSKALFTPVKKQDLGTARAFFQALLAS